MVDIASSESSSCDSLNLAHKVRNFNGTKFEWKIIDGTVDIDCSRLRVIKHMNSIFESYKNF